MHQSYSNQAPLTQPQMNQTQAIQSKPVATYPTPEKGLLPSPVQLCPKRDHCYKSYTTLANHVNWHCKFLDDLETIMFQKHSVPSQVVDFASLAAQLFVQTREHTKTTFSQTQCPFPAIYCKTRLPTKQLLASQMVICQASMKFSKMPKIQLVIFHGLVESNSPKRYLKFVTKS